jgi:hypothetical protein
MQQKPARLQAHHLNLSENTDEAMAVLLKLAHGHIVQTVGMQVH